MVDISTFHDEEILIVKANFEQLEKQNLRRHFGCRFSSGTVRQTARGRQDPGGQPCGHQLSAPREDYQHHQGERIQCHSHRRTSHR